MKWIYLLWLSFLTAVLAEIVFFVFIDPQELYLMGEPVRWSPIAVYSVGFFMFWCLTALTAALTWFMLRPQNQARRQVSSQPRIVPHRPA